MAQQDLTKRDYLLSLWARDKLAERETVSWAIGALTKIRGNIGTESVPLFTFLHSYADRSELQDSLKLLWLLFKKVAQESVYQEGVRSIYDLKTKFAQGHIHSEDVDQLVACLRPRLKAKELSRWAETRGASNDNPLEWVHWDFKIALHLSYLIGSRPSRSQLASLSIDLLLRMLMVGTSALRDALSLARQIGWISEDRDLPNLRVHRVFVPKPEFETAGSSDDQDNYDSDNHNDSFVPIVRLLSEAFEALVEKDAAAGKAVAESWRNENSGLFLRLFAVASLNSDVQTGGSVAQFLSEISDSAFWQWHSFPEIATLRAKRWGSMPSDLRAKIESRLLNGPPKRNIAEEDNATERVVNLPRDHELARIVDTALDVPLEFQKIVSDRRATEPEFPKLVPMVERGLASGRVSWVPEGKPEKFKNVPTNELLSELAKSNRSFGEGDDAEAFAKNSEGKRRILDALEAEPVEEDIAEKGWRLLLSYSHAKDDDPQNDRIIVERIARLALKLSPTLFGRISDQLSYWIDAADEKAPKFESSNELWFALLPHATSQAEKTSELDTSGNDTDLTTAALNEPLGHLLSLFVRRCPTIPAEGERPPMPLTFITELKKLSGRARELLANRLAIQMNYFALANNDWLTELVIEPMTKDGGESDKIWEAFTKYSRVPPPQVWLQLQHHAFRRLSSLSLSPEAKRRLAEMNVVIWIWSKDSKSRFEVDTAKMRTAFGLANDDVRAAVAWQFSTMFRSKADAEEGDVEPETFPPWPKFGRAFFKEIWPLEPALQSAQSANDFAGVPSRVGVEYFGEALTTLLPYLVPFDVWSVHSDFGLDPNEQTTMEILKHFPAEALTLLSACISERQQHGVFELEGVLDQITAARPELRKDNRTRALRRLVLDPTRSVS